jgi:hypothetical protein
MLILRHVVVADDSVDGLYHVAPRQMELLAYYAHAIEHLATTAPVRPDAASDSTPTLPAPGGAVLGRLGAA